MNSVTFFLIAVSYFLGGEVVTRGEYAPVMGFEYTEGLQDGQSGYYILNNVPCPPDTMGIYWVTGTCIDYIPDVIDCIPMVAMYQPDRHNIYFQDSTTLVLIPEGVNGYRHDSVSMTFTNTIN